MAYTAQFSKYDNGNVFAIGGIGANQCYFYDTATRVPFAIVSNIPKAVYSVDFAHSSGRIAVGSGDGSMRIFRYMDHPSESLDIEQE